MCLVKSSMVRYFHDHMANKPLSPSKVFKSFAAFTASSWFSLHEQDLTSNFHLEGQTT